MCQRLIERAPYVRSVKLDEGLNEQTMSIDGFCIFSINLTRSDGNDVYWCSSSL